MRKVLLLLLFVTLFISCNPDAGTITGEVTSVADGDTFTLKTITGERVKVRLYGIDAPERGQDYGTKSRQYLNDLCYKKTVEVKVIDTDQYGRTLGVVYADGLNVNETMVREGLAWYYRHFADDARLDSLEQAAKAQKLNIWSMKNPVSPYEFRKKQKAQH